LTNENVNEKKINENENIDKIIDENLIDENEIQEIHEPQIEEPEISEIPEEEILNESNEEEIEKISQEYDKSISDSVKEYLDSFITESGGNADEIVKKWVELFSCYSIHNEIYAHQCLHLFVGHLLKDIVFYKENKVDDLRFNFFLIQSSGSGKSAALEFLYLMAQFLGIDFKIVVNITEAGLVGSIVEREGRPRYIPGLLDTNDTDGKGRIIWFDEANTFLSLDTLDYNKNIIESVEIALNPLPSPSCKIYKRMKMGTIEYRPKVSFGFTTYPIADKKIIEILKKGLFQRAMPYYHELTEAEWQQLTIDLVKSLIVSNSKKRKAPEQWQEFINQRTLQMKQLAEKIKEVYVFAQQHTNITIASGAPEAILRNFNEKINEMIKNIEPAYRDFFNTFRTRCLNEITKLAIHHAYLDLRDVVVGADFDYAANLIFKIFQSFIIALENFEEIARKESVDMIRWRIFKENFFFLTKKLNRESNMFYRDEFKEMLKQYFKISETSAKKLINSWAKRNLIKIVDEKFIKI
jgi:hypothetical protein